MFPTSPGMCDDDPADVHVALSDGKGDERVVVRVEADVRVLGQEEAHDIVPTFVSGKMQGSPLRGGGAGA